MAIALVQAVKSALHPCAGGSTGTMTVASTGSGNLLVLVMMNGSSGTNIKQTGMSGGGSWVHPGGDSAGAAFLFSSGCAVDAAYVLSSSSGATTISWPMSGNTFHDLAFFYEFSGSSFALDAVGTRAQTFTTTPAGVTLTLSGSNDVIIQGLMGTNNAMSTIDGAYTGNGLYDSADSFVAAAYAINTASGTAPTWGNGNNQYALNAIAFKESGGGGGTPLKLNSSLSGLGASGPFFHDRLA